MQRQKSLYTLVLGLGLAGPFLTVSARDAVPEPEQTIVSTARIPQPLSEVLRPFSSLDRDAIQRAHARDLTELLQGLPGLQFGRTGGAGGQTSLFLRGSGSTQALVLLDGVRIASASAGSAPWESLALQQVERIEVVRGAHSALYGSDAIGGVVQIFTRAAGENLQSLQVGVGNRSRIESAARISRQLGSHWWSLGLAQAGTQGIDQYRNAAPDPVNDDPDAFREHSLKLAAGGEWDNGTRWRLDYLEMRNEAEYDSVFLACTPGSDAARLGTDGCFPDRRNENLLSVGGAEIEFPVAERWTARLRLHRTRNDNENPGRSIRTRYPPPDFLPTPVLDAGGRLLIDDSSTNFDTLRDSVSWQNEMNLGESRELVFGIDYYRDRLHGAAYQHNGRRVRDRENTGIFAEYLLRAGAHSLVLAGRLVDNEQYGHQDAGSIDWGLHFAEGLLFAASVGKAFRAPTFNDLYFPGGFGNPDLEPEESLHYELSLKAPGLARHWAVYFFASEVDDAIVLDAGFVPQNAGDAELRGVEFEYGRHWKHWAATASFSFLDPEDARQAAFARRARREFKLKLDYGVGKRWLGAELLGRGERYDTGGQRLSGYATVSAYGGVQLNPEWRLQLRLSNWFDRNYTLVDGYNTEGFGVFVSFTWSRQGTGTGSGAGAGRGI